MSIHTLTCDEFMDLSSAHHRTALRLYSAEIDALIEALAALPDKASPAYATDSTSWAACLPCASSTRCAWTS